MGFRSKPTISLGYDDGEVAYGAVGVTEPAAVELEEDGGRGDVSCSLADAHCGMWTRRSCEHNSHHEATWVSKLPSCLPSSFWLKWTGLERESRSQARMKLYEDESCLISFIYQDYIAGLVKLLLDQNLQKYHLNSTHAAKKSKYSCYNQNCLVFLNSDINPI